MAEVSPFELANGPERPRRLRLEPTRVSELAKQYSITGRDSTVRSFLPLSSICSQSEVITYLSSPRFSAVLKDCEGVAVITKPELREHVPAGNTVVLTDADPKDIFYTMMADAVESGRFELLKGYVSPSARVASGAMVSQHVYIDDGAEIYPGAVILPNSYVGRHAVVKPNATVGGDGFENATLHGRRRVVPHAGGVWLSEGVQIGSATCVDRGLFGDFTFLGEFTTVDNLVHFAHSAVSGANCALVACCEISGSVTLGNGVWVGPNASINQLLNIGDHCYIGTGSVVTRNLPQHTLAFGSPAKPAAQVCVCRAKIQFESGIATCANCGRSFKQDATGAVYCASAR